MLLESTVNNLIAPELLLVAIIRFTHNLKISMSLNRQSYGGLLYKYYQALISKRLLLGRSIDSFLGTLPSSVKENKISFISFCFFLREEPFGDV